MRICFSMVRFVDFLCLSRSPEKLSTQRASSAQRTTRNWRPLQRAWTLSRITKLRYNLFRRRGRCRVNWKRKGALPNHMLNLLERKILSAFDRPDAGALSIEELADIPAARGVLEQLVERSWLRAGAAAGTYERTEDGRLQLARPSDVTIYSRPGCHLCEEAKSQITPLLSEFGARLTEINIDEDPGLRALYDYDVPVIFLGARKAAKHRVDLVQFRRQLHAAGQCSES
jgi:glutaredoxin